MINFYFFHVGDDQFLPNMMINSIRKTNINSKIYQLTDRFSPEVKDVDKCYRFDGYIKNIMKLRMEAYSKVKSIENSYSIFVDTDMLVLQKINEAELFQNFNTIFCKREIGLGLNVNINFKNMNMVEYKNITLGDAWPYLGCFIALKNHSPLIEMNEIYNKLDKKYKIWYGDQIALKKFVNIHSKTISFVGENEYAYLPNGNQIPSKTKILHFKGEKLKKLMKKYYDFYFQS